MNSIRRQLTRDLLIVVLVLSIAGLMALYFAARSAAIDQFDQALEAKALAVCSMTVPGADAVTVPFADRFLRGFDDKTPSDFFMIWDAKGRVLERSESLPSGELSHRHGLPGSPVFWDLALPSGQPGRAIALVYHPRDPADSHRETPALDLVVATGRDGLDGNLRALLAIVGGCMALLGLGICWLVPSILRRGLASLNALGQQAAGINENTLHTRFPSSGAPEELVPIIERLNALLARLEQSFEKERRFSADLAHEFRTPLAELRSFLECCIKWPDTRDERTDETMLQILKRLEGMVGTMLAIARSENGFLEWQNAELSMDALIKELIAEYQGQADRRDIRLKTELMALPVVANPLLLRSILSNLIENAAHYCDAGGEIRLRLSQEEGRSVFEIINDAADLSQSDVPHLFDRFWRKERARSGGRHVGLGLSISQSFAKHMGWTLTAECPAQGKICFRLGAP